MKKQKMVDEKKFTREFPNALWNEIVKHTVPHELAGVDTKYAEKWANQCRNPALERKRTIPSERYICPFHPLIPSRYLPLGSRACCMPKMLATPQDWAEFSSFTHTLPDEYRIVIQGIDEDDKLTLYISKISNDLLSKGYEFENTSSVYIKDGKGQIVASYQLGKDDNLLHATHSEQPSLEEELASDEPTTRYLWVRWSTFTTSTTDNRELGLKMARQYGRNELVDLYNFSMNQEHTREEEGYNSEDEEDDEDYMEKFNAYWDTIVK